MLCLVNITVLDHQFLLFAFEVISPLDVDLSLFGTKHQASLFCYINHLNFFKNTVSIKKLLISQTSN